MTGERGMDEMYLIPMQQQVQAARKELRECNEYSGRFGLALCEKDAPDLFRQMSLRSERYNEHLTPHSVLLEVGAAGNTLRQALRSVEFFADELAELLTAASATPRA